MLEGKRMRDNIKGIQSKSYSTSGTLEMFCLCSWVYSQISAQGTIWYQGPNLEILHSKHAFILLSSLSISKSMSGT